MLPLAGIPTFDQKDKKGPRYDTCCLPASDCLATDPNFNPARNFPYISSATSLSLSPLSPSVPRN